jgi:hypothetical protein
MHVKEARDAREVRKAKEVIQIKRKWEDER